MVRHKISEHRYLRTNFKLAKTLQLPRIKFQDHEIAGEGCGRVELGSGADTHSLRGECTDNIGVRFDCQSLIVQQKKRCKCALQQNLCIQNIIFALNGDVRSRPAEALQEKWSCTYPR